MNPPMIFGQVYSMCLNVDARTIDSSSLNDPKHADFEMNFENAGHFGIADVKEMCRSNIPFVELTMHWSDPLSRNGSNGWVQYTYFFPKAEVINGKLELGAFCRTETQIPGFRYLPYFGKNILQAPMSGGVWLDITDEEIARSINVCDGGSVYKIAEMELYQIAQLGKGNVTDERILEDSVVTMMTNEYREVTDENNDTATQQSSAGQNQTPQANQADPHQAPKANQAAPNQVPTPNQSEWAAVDPASYTQVAIINGENLKTLDEHFGYGVNGKRPQWQLGPGHSGNGFVANDLSGGALVLTTPALTNNGHLTFWITNWPGGGYWTNLMPKVISDGHSLDVVVVGGALKEAWTQVKAGPLSPGHHKVTIEFQDGQSRSGMVRDYKVDDIEIWESKK